MTVLNQVGSLCWSEVDCFLGKILLMVLWLSILREVLARAEVAAKWLFTESPNSWAKVLWILVEDWVLAKSGGVEWLQIVSWTWRNILLFFIIHHFEISWALSLPPKLLFEAKRRALSISSRYGWVIYWSVDGLLWVICSRTYFSLIVSFGEMVLSLRSTISPFDSTFGRLSHSFACWVNIIGSWA